jgi:hypothetical protein
MSYPPSLLRSFGATAFAISLSASAWLRRDTAPSRAVFPPAREGGWLAEP